MVSAGATSKEASSAAALSSIPYLTKTPPRDANALQTPYFRAKGFWGFYTTYELAQSLLNEARASSAASTAPASAAPEPVPRRMKVDLACR